MGENQLFNVFDVFSIWISDKSVLDVKENRKKICKILVDFKKEIKSRVLLGNLKKEDIVKKYPFQYYMFHEYSYDFSVQRSAVTSMGQKLIPHLIVEIAKMRGFFAQQNFNAKLFLNNTAVNEIKQYIEKLRKKEKTTNIDNETEMIISLAKKYSEKNVVYPLQMDILIKKQDYELYIELKTPKPKNEDCKVVKERFLLFMLDYAYRLLEKGFSEDDVFNILKQSKALGFYYNPFDKSILEIRKSGRYPHSFVNYYFDLREILICEELWDIVGGKRTFEHLTKIISTIVEFERKEQIDKACDEI